MLKNDTKLLIMHGLDDDMVPPTGSIRFYEDVAKAMGGYDKIENNIKLYFLPGLNHSFKGPGINLRTLDLSPLIDWVENGIVPDEIIGKKAGVGERPFYPYPYYTEYVGGPVDKASSYSRSLSQKDAYLREASKVTWCK